MKTNDESHYWNNAISKTYFLLLTILLTSYSHGLAQYFPQPVPGGPGIENLITKKLKSTKLDNEKIPLMLYLSNLNFYKAPHNAENLNKAKINALSAKKLSIKLSDQQGLNNANLLIADVLMDANDMPGAESILIKVDDTTRIDLLLNLSWKYLERVGGTKEKDRQIALNFANEALQLSIRHQLKIKQILAYKAIAIVHANQGKSSGLAELLDVVKMFKSAGYRNLHYTYFLLSTRNFYIGNYQKSLYFSLETIKSIKSTGDTVQIADFYFWQAYVFKKLGQFKDCIYYGQLALNSYEYHWGLGNVFIAVNLISDAMRSLKLYSESLDFLNENLKKYHPSNNTDLSYIAWAYGNAYLALKQYDLAIRYFQKGYKIDKLQNGRDSRYAEMLSMAYVAQRKFELARPYLNSLLKASDRSLPLEELGHVHFMMHQVDSASGMYFAAMKHLEESKKIDDSVLTDSKNKEIQRLLIQFQSLKKEAYIKARDQDIRLLNQKNILQQKDLQHSNFVKDVSYAGIAVLLLIIALLVRQYKIKSRSNQIILNKNNLLQSLLKEKEWLLKEIHHRVKNNLHTVICLLESQAASLEDDALKAIENSQHRIYAMSLIHQKLYESSDIKIIDMSVYIPELISYLDASIQNNKRIHFHLEIEALNLSVSQATPLALIINEAITNSMKYAFPDKANGVIAVKMSQYDQQIKLIVSDNGVGFAPELASAKRNSLGFKLINGLSEDINGTINIVNDHGTKITIVFNVDHLKDQHHYLN